ncbi:unnamed protein product [Prorocentrum cordatum]|uniref:Band 7 domain-containing protein n=1 Tax=Prorocentrum cordatum TaxID=2364126 RepID=A0ABN9ST11_9DINO|nr:unnamed protein product [Polarella glacialis]
MRRLSASPHQPAGVVPTRGFHANLLLRRLPSVFFLLLLLLLLLLPLVLHPYLSHFSRFPPAPAPFRFVVLFASQCRAQISGDAEDGSWEPGFHCVWPWHSVDRLVSKQLIVFDAPVKACKTKDDISINLDTLVVLEMEQAFDFVYKLGPDKLDDLLRAMQPMPQATGLAPERPGGQRAARAPCGALAPGLWDV